MSGGDRDLLPRDHDAVRRAYRSAGFRDEPPAAIDAAIIDAARRSTRRKVRTLLAPLAMAATVLLAFGLVLRLTMPGADVAGPAAERAREAPSAAVEEATPPRPARSVAPGPAAPAATPRAAPATAESSLADAPAQDFQRAGRAEAQMQAADTLTTGGCTALHDGEPGPWLDCIRTQLEAGETGVARAELEAFRDAHPELPIPAEISAGLGP
jgi:hypothetical protein